MKNTLFTAVMFLTFPLLGQQAAGEAKNPRVAVDCNCNLIDKYIPGFCGAFNQAVQDDWPKGESDWLIHFESKDKKCGQQISPKNKKEEFILVLTHKGEQVTAIYRMSFAVRGGANFVDFSEPLAKEVVQVVLEYRQLVAKVTEDQIRAIFTAPKVPKKSRK